jgi:hypothetical protein
MQSCFAGIEQAQPGFGSNYLHPGHIYTLLVSGNKAAPSQKKRGVINFIGEFRVLEGTDPARPPGSQASYVCPTDKASSLGNWKAYMAAVCGLNPSDTDTVNREITQQLCEFVVGPQQPLSGKDKQSGRLIIVRCTTEQVPTKQVGGVYTKHSFMPILPGSEDYNRLAAKAEQMLSSAPTPTLAAAPQQAPQGQLPYHPQAHMMGQGYQPQMAPPPTAQAPYAGPTQGQPSPYGALAHAPQQAAPPPVASGPQWVTHPDNPAYEYLPGTQQFRLKGQG